MTAVKGKKHLKCVFSNFVSPSSPWKSKVVWKRSLQMCLIQCDRQYRPCCTAWTYFWMSQPCFPGLISSEDRGGCRLCPAGFSCDPADGTFSLCPPGQHSPEGALRCLPCPVDSVCTSGFPIRVNGAEYFNYKPTMGYLWEENVQFVVKFF